MNTENTEKKSKKISVRLDEKNLQKLGEIQAARGLNQTEAIIFSINNIPILKIGNVECLGEEFFRLRKAIEENAVDEEVKKGVNELCQSTLDLLVKIEN